MPVTFSSSNDGKERKGMTLLHSRVLLAVFVGLLAGCGGETQPEPGPKPPTGGKSDPALRVHCGGTMFATIKQLCATYEQETGLKIALKKGGSGPLFRKAVADNDCDVYVCHAPFLVEARKARVIDVHHVVAGLRPIIVVAKGNPRKIKGVADLARKDVSVGVTHETLSTAGWVAPVYFRRAGIEKAMAAKKILRTEGSGAMANAVISGKVDAGIIWNAAAYARREKLDIVEVQPEHRPRPDVDAITTATHGKFDLSDIKVTVIVFKFARDKAAARKFAAFVNSRRGRAAFAKNGFLPAPK
jgi:molybdate transport system substrate-binding protein